MWWTKKQSRPLKKIQNMSCKRTENVDKICLRTERQVHNERIKTNDIEKID